MSYIDNNLMPNEKIIVSTELHWVIFLWPMIATFCIIYFMFHQHIMELLNIAAVLVIAYLLGNPLIEYLTTDYALTTNRAIVKRGLIFVRVMDMSVTRIESVQLQQSLLGNILGYATVVVNGTGGDRLVFTSADEPAVLREKIFEMIEQGKNS